MRRQRAGEIDYYEELGVDRNATQEDIRESFRALVRLLHPDHQQDEQLRSIAQTQLRKVNRIYAVLSDPERRQRYDELLEDDPLPSPAVFRPPINVDAKQLVTRMVWIGAAVLGVAIVIWFATDPPSTPVFSSPERVIAASKRVVPPVVGRSAAPSQSNASVPTAASLASEEEIAQLRAALRAARLERDEANQELAQLRANQELAVHAAPPPSSAAGSPPAPSNLTSASTSLAELTPSRTAPAAPHTVLPSPAPSVVRTFRPSGSDPRQFAGFWFFARSSQTNHNKSLYPPEFIEATLTELNGVIHGKYRSRYRIVDRAISPDVNFEFSGTPAGAIIACAWNGSGGAKGQLTLQMTDENNIKVDWTASDIGSIQGLASGTATLTRRLE